MITGEEVRREWRIPGVKAIGLSAPTAQFPTYVGFPHIEGDRDYAVTDDIPGGYQPGEVAYFKPYRDGHFSFVKCPYCETVVNAPSNPAVKVGAMHCPTCSHVLLPENQFSVDSQYEVSRLFNNPKYAPYYAENIREYYANQKLGRGVKKTGNKKFKKLFIIVLSIVIFLLVKDYIIDLLISILRMIFGH